MGVFLTLSGYSSRSQQRLPPGRPARGSAGGTGCEQGEPVTARGSLQLQECLTSSRARPQHRCGVLGCLKSSPATERDPQAMLYSERKTRQSQTLFRRRHLLAQAMPDMVPFPFSRGRAPHADPSPPLQRNPAAPQVFFPEEFPVNDSTGDRQPRPPRESRPRLLFALVVVGRRVLPFLDHLVPLLEDGSQPHSLAKRRREGRGRHTTGSRQSGKRLGGP